MSDFSERVFQLREFLGLSQRKMAEKIGAKQGQVSTVESGRSTPSIDFLSKIAVNIEGLSLKWLVLGNGDMWEKNDPSALGIREGSLKQKLSQDAQLRNLTDLAQQGGSLGAWQLWLELAEQHPESVNTEGLANATGLTASEVKTGLAVLKAYELVKEENDGIRFSIGVLRTVEPISTAEHTLEAIRLLLKTIGPKLTKGNHTGKLATATFPVKSAEVALEALTKAVKTTYDEQLDENGEDTIVLILGVADATLKVGK